MRVSGYDWSMGRGTQNLKPSKEGSLAGTGDSICLDHGHTWVIPDFLKRPEDRKPEVLEYTFRRATGQLALDLSCVPIDRLQG